MPLLTNHEEFKRLLQEARTIAVVGYSDKPDRDSNRVGRYLTAAGYTVYPVNPGADEIDGLKAYATLADLPEQVDIVDVFRRPEHLPEIAEAAIAAGAKALWAQLGVVNQAAAQLAADAGLDVVMDRCIKVEHARLLG